MEGLVPDKRGVERHGILGPMCNVYALKIREIQLVTFLLTNLYPPDTISQTANTRQRLNVYVMILFDKNVSPVCVSKLGQVCTSKQDRGETPPRSGGH